MIKKNFPWVGSLVAMIAVGVLSGCPNTADGVAKDTEHAAEATSQAVDKAGEKVAQGVEKTGEAVSQAANNAGKVAEKAGTNATAALEVTPKVKVAITADTELNDPKNHIDVDSKDGVVHLKGYVASNALKAKAGAIAEKAIKDLGGTDKVMNQLLVK